MSIAHAISARAIQTANSEAKMKKAFDWARANPDVMAWIDANMENEFGGSLAQSLNDYGSLTENQCVAVRKKINAAANARPMAVVSVAAIEAIFEKAKTAGVKKPKIRLDTFIFKPAGESSANAGGIYVTEKHEQEGNVYLGKVLGGMFTRSRDCSTEQETRVIAAASDPVKAAEAYGRRYGACSICGRTLTKEESIDRFVGPVCASKYGF